MSKELEEAIKELENWKDTVFTLQDNNKTAKATETVLQALENSISKDTIKEKILELDKKITDGKLHKLTVSEMICVITALQQLLEE